MNNWKKYGFEFLTIFIGVFAAFALENWKDNINEKKAASKILLEIRNGLEKDTFDMIENLHGHERSIEATKYFKDLLINKKVNSDSFNIQYFNLLRNFISLQNVSGYESLKSKGLEIIENDSLRSQIISIYEYDYSILKKLEEDYSELQFHNLYFDKINSIIAPNLIYSDDGTFNSLKIPFKVSNENRNIFLNCLIKIKYNRFFINKIYNETLEKVKKTMQMIDNETKKNKILIKYGQKNN